MASLRDHQLDHDRDEWLALTKYLRPISPEALDALKYKTFYKDMKHAVQERGPAQGAVGEGARSSEAVD